MLALRHGFPNLAMVPLITKMIHAWLPSHDIT
jgi:hypothetical protein